MVLGKGPLILSDKLYTYTVEEEYPWWNFTLAGAPTVLHMRSSFKLPLRAKGYLVV